MSETILRQKKHISQLAGKVWLFLERVVDDYFQEKDYQKITYLEQYFLLYYKKNKIIKNKLGKNKCGSTKTDIAFYRSFIGLFETSLF